ncbi:hypothetical protein A3770_12p66400 [Chloropicon primus]|uniref:Uncharacterized protein n=1 Tax=Chloropicon primus TaxID=1764295 RepID=A0A5B8MX18_9CHLO|nr:hypothetical protein A3770_12p66400 [Chloropicon primus]|eukprot:QDZ24122.1 hypothetical protein A3770_12p66400 [Chloropicon primus]
MARPGVQNLRGGGKALAARSTRSLAARSSRKQVDWSTLRSRSALNLRDWEVAKLHDGEFIGRVVEVIEPHRGVGHALLNVVINNPAGGGLEEEYRLIPLVSDIVPYLDSSARKVFVDPPAGLLDLDSDGFLEEEDELRFLKRELEALVGKTNQLPSRSQFESLGRCDLQKIVEKQGGHFEVAACLGYKPFKNPPGYWDSENIEAEVAKFLESFWVVSRDQMRHSLTGETRTSAEGLLATKLLPNLKLLVDSGRHDLVYAIKMNGGFKATAKELGRTIYSPKMVHKHRLQWDFHYFEKEMRKVMEHPDCLKECPTMDKLPAQRLIRKIRRHDVDAAISHHGGYYEVARKMNLKSSFKRVRGYWNDKENLLREIRAFVSNTTNLDGATCPPYSELESAGRLDLKYGIEIHGGRKAITSLLLKEESGVDR